MVDAATLRDLGWSEELISEVTRCAELVRESEPQIAPESEPPADRPSVTDVIHVGWTAVQTATVFPADHVREPVPPRGRT
jgi:hypothetical protein